MGIKANSPPPDILEKIRWKLEWRWGGGLNQNLVTLLRFNFSNKNGICSSNALDTNASFFQPHIKVRDNSCFRCFDHKYDDRSSKNDSKVFEGVSVKCTNMQNAVFMHIYDKKLILNREGGRLTI